MQQAQGPLRESLLGRIRDEIGRRERFAVFSHEEPDGDAIGSQIALTLALRKLGKTVVSFRYDGVPPALEFLNRNGALTPSRPGKDEEAVRDAEAVVVLDSCDYFRLGDMAEAVKACGAFKINIDHHRDNSFFGDINYVRFEAGGRGAGLRGGAGARCAGRGGRRRGPLRGHLHRHARVQVHRPVGQHPAGRRRTSQGRARRRGASGEALLSAARYLARRHGGASPADGVRGRRRHRLVLDPREPDPHLRPAGPGLRDDAPAFKHAAGAGGRDAARGQGGVEIWLRSKAGVDVGAAAKRLGGGGHRTAAGALVKGMGVGEAARRVTGEMRAAIRGDVTPRARS